LFRGHFLLSPFSVNDSCYGSDGRHPLHSNLYTVKKSAPFFNLTLHILQNLHEKFYQCINFGARCIFEHNRDTPFGHLVFTEDYLFTHAFFCSPVTTAAGIVNEKSDLIKNRRRTSYNRKLDMKTTIFLKMD
jgi:hypothetical protein